MSPLEPEHADAQQAVPAQLVVEAGWHRAEILADDNGARAPRFERDQAHQVIEWETHIRALGRTRAMGDQPQTRQTSAWSMRSPPAWPNVARSISIKAR